MLSPIARATLLVFAGLPLVVHAQAADSSAASSASATPASVPSSIEPSSATDANPANAGTAANTDANAVAQTATSTILSPVVVTAERGPQALADAIPQTSLFDQQDLADTTATDLPGLLQLTPGAQISRTGGPGSTASLYLRGASTTQSLLLIDGVRVDSVSLGAPQLAQIPLDQITHTFYAGEIWCVAGPNGAGKTTLLSTLAGLLQPASGHVELDGVRVSDWQPLALAQRRALMPQSAPDAFSASVLDIVMLNRFPHLSSWGWERDADRAAAHDALDLLGLAAFAARDVLSLSGGERQRVALAAVLCQDAPLLLLDEPLSHLDLHHQIDCLDALAAWTREPRRTVMFSCHDLNLARRFATHALLLDGSGGVYAGPVHDVLTPALTSRAFGYPLILIRDGEHEALIPAPRVRHESPAGNDTPAA